jgi:hypothetical protein
MKINKDKLLKYAEYLKETLDPWKLKQGIKSFNRLSEESITIHGDLKDLSSELTGELSGVKLPYTKLLNFGGIEVDIKIIQSNRNYSNVDWVKFLKGDYEVTIEVEEGYDINYVISTIIHEIRHMIDFTDENINSGLSSFDMDRNLRKYNIDVFHEFFILVYISLEHELVARNNQIYPYIKFKKLTKEESIEILKQSFIWKALEMLKEFDYKKFVSKFDESILINITNNFIKDCLYDNDTIIENTEEVLTFYKIWEDYFNEVSGKWEKLLLSEVSMVYERKINLNNHVDNYRYIIKNMWLKLNQCSNPKKINDI